MDILTIAAVFALLNDMVPGFADAAQDAIDAAASANSAAAGAAEYAQMYYRLETSVNMLVSQHQQEVRDLRDQVETLQKQLAALAGN